MSRITSKNNIDYQQLIQNGPITIVAFGDSVTHGAVGPGELEYCANRAKKES